MNFKSRLASMTPSEIGHSKPIMQVLTANDRNPDLMYDQQVETHEIQLSSRLWSVRSDSQEVISSILKISFREAYTRRHTMVCASVVLNEDLPSAYQENVSLTSGEIWKYDMAPDSRNEQLCCAFSSKTLLGGNS